MRFLTSFLFLLLVFNAQATIRYVDMAATGANTGLNWTDASVDIQSMLALSAAGDTIYVAQGTYQPAANSSYVLPNNLKLFGGFPHGGNPGFINRNWVVYPTNLQGDKVQSLFGSISNSVGVTIVDGFYITGASQSTAIQGGIAYVSGSAPVQFSNCDFSNNNSFTQGGLFYVLSNPMVLSNCSFTNNSGTQEGGLLYFNTCSAQLNHCFFANNSSTAAGGLVFTLFGAPVFSYCSFQQNTGTQGVDLYFDFGTPLVDHCNFLNNTAVDALLFNNEGTPVISNSIFANNTSTGIVILENLFCSQPGTMVNCVLYNNQSTQNSFGTLISNNSSSFLVDNSTFYSNAGSGTVSSSFFNNVGSSSLSFSNSIITGNTAGTIFAPSSSPAPTFSYSIVQGITDAANFVSSVTPLFVNASNPIGADGMWGTADDGLALLSGSPGIDAGNNTLIPAGITTDITGSPRIQNSIVDFGAYEYIPQPGPTVVTSPGVTSYTVLSAPVAVDNAITVTDGSSATLASATVKIASNFSAGDILAFTNNGSMGNIAGSYNSATGLLTLTSAGATASLAQWQLALQAIVYSNSLASPNLSNRSISFQVNDGTYSSNIAYKTIVLQAGNTCMPTSSSTNQSICASSLPFSWNGTNYSASGSYTVHLLNAGGCDSAATLNLTVNTATSSTTNQSICASSLPFSWNGNNYSASGSYTVHLLNAGGCDSAATLNLTVNTATSSTTNQSVCASSLPFNWNGNNYSAAGSYTIHLTNAAGCDSAATLNLAIGGPTSSTTNQSVCASSLPFSWNGNSYNAAGSYTVHISNAAGCDSAATLNLTVSEAVSSTTSETVCSALLPYSWNGNSYNAAGSYSVSLQSVTGCDSVATLNLTVTEAASGTSRVMLCPTGLPYTWNGSSYNTFGTYTAVIPTAANCDSLATLELVNLGSSLSDSNRFNVLLSPNPVSDYLSITVSFPCGIIVFNEVPQVVVYNIIGQKLLQTSMPQNNLQVNVSGFKAGIYVVRYFGNGYEAAQKFIKW